MNLLESNGEASSDVFFVNFNQDCTSLAVGNKKGFKLFAFTKVDELEVIHECTDDDVRAIERLFSSSLIAMVTIAAPRKLKVCHFKKRSEICNYSYSNTILAVKINRARLVVCLEESLYIHNIRDMKVLHTIRDTPPNPLGLCVLSSNDDNNFLAYPGSSSIGEVQIFDALNLCSKNMIPAHDNPLVAMAFDSTGTKIATASEKGTVIRVFNVLDKTKLYEFRRGMKRCVRIYSLSFSEDCKFLSASSNTETVHIFRLDDPREIKPVEEPQSWTSYFGKVISNSASLLPNVADMFYQGRSFATVHLPFSGLRNICALAMIQKVLRVLVLSSEGILYIYNVDTKEGGDCVLECRHVIADSDGENNGTKSLENNPSEMTLPSLPTETPNVSANIPVNVRRPLQTGSSSYAAVVRGSDGSSAQEIQEDGDNDHKDPAIHSLLRYDLKVDYENDFPPMVHKSSN